MPTFVREEFVRKCSPNPTVQPPAPGARLAFAGAEQARRWEPS